MKCYLCKKNIKYGKSGDYYDKGIIHDVHMSCLPKPKRLTKRTYLNMFEVKPKKADGVF